MNRNCESLCQSVSQLRRDGQKMANHFPALSTDIQKYYIGLVQQCNNTMPLAKQQYCKIINTILQQ